MADVFVSYARADVSAARAIAERIEHEGLSVWWDKKIPIGEAFDEELDKQLDKARSVVVLWSSRSVTSEWVKNEAAEGLAKKALFPVMLEAVRLPFGFRRVQTADLTDWTPAERHAGLDRLIAALHEALGGGAGTREPTAASATLAGPPGWFVYRWRRSIVFRVVATALPVMLMGAGAVAMTQLRVPTPVHLELPVRRVEFTVGGSGATPVLEPLAFSSLRIEHFESVTFSPKVMSVVSDPRPDAKSGPGTWRELDLRPGEVTLAARDGESSVWIEPLPGDTGQVGTLDRLYLQPGSVVTLERKVRQRGVELGVRIENLPRPLTPAANAASKPYRIYAAHVDTGELGLPDAASEWMFEVENKDSSPAIGIRSLSERLNLALGMAASAALALLPRAGTPITRVTLIAQDADRNWESTLTADGRLSYPDHPDVAAVDVAKSDLIGLDGLSGFSITQLELDPGGESLNLRLIGTARNIKTRAGEIALDRRLTVLEVYRSKATTIFWATMIAGALSALWSAFTALRELRA